MATVRCKFRSEEGAVLPLMVLLMVVLLGLGAFAVDAGVQWNGRRQAQTAADAGALAGAWEIPSSVTDARDAAQDYVRRNLDTTYDAATWAALWTSCVDFDRPASFTPVPGTDCISIDDAAGLFRVRVPTQSFPTVFSGVLGVKDLNASATATAKFNRAAVRPFGVPANPGAGEYCLQQPPGGHAELPCDGPDSGNFGSLFSPRYTLGCPGNKGDALVMNIVRGVDKTQSVWNVGDPYVLDACFNSYPNQVETDTGNFPNEITDGLITGGPALDAADIPVLQQGTNPKRDVIVSGTTYGLDNRPLWSYLVANSTPGCQAADFVGKTGLAATDQMTTCLRNWSGGELFDQSILKAPRLFVIPEFVENSLPSGSSEPRTIARFRAVYIHALGFKNITFFPGESGTFIADQATIEQTSAFVLPNTPTIAGHLATDASGVLRALGVELVR